MLGLVNETPQVSEKFQFFIIDAPVALLAYSSQSIPVYGLANKSVAVKDVRITGFHRER